jgi:hypothetical protein
VSAGQVLPSESLPAQDAFNAILKQDQYPVVVVEGGEDSRHIVRLPFRDDNYAWLRGEKLHKPKWDADRKHWTVPKAWRREVAEKCIDRFGGVIVVQVSPKELEKCAHECWVAKSPVTKCECSCGGINHGNQANPGGFYEINETLAVKWTGGEQLIATFITASGSIEVASATP